MARTVSIAPALVAMAFLAASEEAQAQAAGTPAEARERVMGLLMAYEHVPDAAEFTSLGPAAHEALLAAAPDGTLPPFVRGRAVWALAFFPDRATRQTIETLLDDPDLDEMIVRRALGALAAAFGDESLGRVRGYLDDPRPDVREAAARALGEIGGAAALRALQRRLGRERAAQVRETIAEEIARVERRGAR